MPERNSSLPHFSLIRGEGKQVMSNSETLFIFCSQPDRRLLASDITQRQVQFHYWLEMFSPHHYLAAEHIVLMNKNTKACLFGANRLFKLFR